MIPETSPGTVVEDEVAAGGAITVGTTGIVGVIVLGVAATPRVGTAATELTPRLLISVEPSGIPVRLTPPTTVGEVGVDDATALFDPEPHIPDIPAVSVIPEGVDRPELGNVPDDISGDNAVLPAIDAVAGIEDEADVPPPSKVALEPNIWDDEVPRVEQAAARLGIAMVPVGLDGTGLVPAEVISVAPSGIPVGETDEPDMLPSGEVAPIAGVGVTMALPEGLNDFALPDKAALVIGAEHPAGRVAAATLAEAGARLMIASQDNCAHSLDTGPSAHFRSRADNRTDHAVAFAENVELAVATHRQVNIGAATAVFDTVGIGRPFAIVVTTPAAHDCRGPRQRGVLLPPATHKNRADYGCAKRPKKNPYYRVSSR